MTVTGYDMQRVSEMKRQLRYAVLMSVVCWASVSFGQEAQPSLEAQPTSAGEPVSALRAQSTKSGGRPVLVSIPPLLEPIQRAPVMFWHDKHSDALKADGCALCHPKRLGQIDFSFPKTRNESSRKTLTASYHDACITCHTQRSKAHKSSGPVTCGECHADKNTCLQNEYLPVIQTQYDILNDPYHRKCTTCHLKPTKAARDVADLDWKTFYVQAKGALEKKLPESVFDYGIHDKHVKTLEKRCELCHYISPVLKDTLAAEGRKPTSQDWLREVEPGKSLKEKDSAHLRCINCHLARNSEQKTHGPVDCRGCHVDRQRAADEAAPPSPPEYDNKERILIHAEKTSMASVPFDHKAHIATSTSCNGCHHDTLEACVKCHTHKGAKVGNFITLADAYHRAGSTRSCIGCHAREKEKPDCAGCHHLREAKLTACGTCHTGRLESLDQILKLPDPATLFPTNLTEEIELSLLAGEFETGRIKHKDIARKLTDISNNSRLATAFHKRETTVCAGCHHMGHVESKQNVPACAECHTVLNVPSDNTPNLLGAYHQACLGCHMKMGYPEEKMPQACTGCHKEKKILQ